jgi:hypothetical protein
MGSSSFRVGRRPGAIDIVQRPGRPPRRERAIAGRMRAPRAPRVAGILVRWYHYTLVNPFGSIAMPVSPKRFDVERVQTGVRMERRILKVLKALAEYKNISLGDLLEGIVLHVFEGKTPFTADTVRKIAELKNIYELDLDARASHRLREK